MDSIIVVLCILASRTKYGYNPIHVTGRIYTLRVESISSYIIYSVLRTYFEELSYEDPTSAWVTGPVNLNAGCIRPNPPAHGLNTFVDMSFKVVGGGKSLRLPQGCRNLGALWLQCGCNVAAMWLQGGCGEVAGGQMTQ